MIVGGRVNQIQFIKRMLYYIIYRQCITGSHVFSLKCFNMFDSLNHHTRCDFQSKQVSFHVMVLVLGAVNISWQTSTFNSHISSTYRVTYSFWKKSCTSEYVVYQLSHYLWPSLFLHTSGDHRMSLTNSIEKTNCFLKPHFWVHSLKLTLRPRKWAIPKRNDRIPTIHFQVLLLLVSGRVPSGKEKHTSHEKNPPAFHYTGWLMGILISWFIIIPI